jgi:hypothetical protein
MSITAAQIDSAPGYRLLAMAMGACEVVEIPNGCQDWTDLLTYQIADFWRDLLEWLLDSYPVGPYPHPVYCAIFTALQGVSGLAWNDTGETPVEFIRRALKAVAGVS